MERTFAALGAVSAFLAVAAGAFGAHGLRQRLSADMLAVFEIAVRYQMYHALALLAVSLGSDSMAQACPSTFRLCICGGHDSFFGEFVPLVPDRRPLAGGHTSRRAGLPGGMARVRLGCVEIRSLRLRSCETFKMNVEEAREQFGLPSLCYGVLRRLLLDRTCG